MVKHKVGLQQAWPISNQPSETPPAASTFLLRLSPTTMKCLKLNGIRCPQTARSPRAAGSAGVCSLSHQQGREVEALIPAIALADPSVITQESMVGVLWVMLRAGWRRPDYIVEALPFPTAKLVCPPALGCDFTFCSLKLWMM